MIIQMDPRIMEVRVDEKIRVILADGREVAVPVEWFPRLKNATSEQRARVEIQASGAGLRWPLVDEDIEASALLSQGQIVVFGEGDYLIEDDGSLDSVPTVAARA